ncbi:DUF1963 domain-containing protein [Flavobacterium sp.]|jgi:uncharacterized protein YwqG|uniref:DUF1963 domain-containing protein n=1 Tax=Flavobacterium sp. TaxID=239 RepID=UPI0037C1051D
MYKDRIVDLINKKVKDEEKIIRLLLPTIGIKLNSDKAEFGLSKIGGLPPIFEGSWPLLQHSHMTFLGQLSLSQINSINKILPDNGFLCFFIFTGDVGYRYPDKKGEFKVFYIQEGNSSAFIRTDFLEVPIIKESQISFFEYFTFPSYQESKMEKEIMTEEELDIIHDIESEILILINENCETEHQLLGYPRALQGPVEFWWAVKYLGLLEKDSYTAEELFLIKSEAENFILILQINFGDPNIEIDYFGDSVAYFGIHKKDLQNGNFDDVVLVMQNT